MVISKGCVKKASQKLAALSGSENYLEPKKKKINFQFYDKITFYILPFNMDVLNWNIERLNK